MSKETLESAVQQEVHTRALALVDPRGHVPVGSKRFANIRERRVQVFRVLMKLVCDCVAYGVRYEDARRFAETGVWIVDKAYGKA